MTAILGLLVLGSIATSASAFDQVSDLLSRAEAEQLAQRPDWRRLLFYAPFTMRGAHGVIDDPSFYLSPKGASNPDAELVATLSTFFEPQDPNNLDRHALCRYPARKLWLETNLGISEHDWPKVNCPRLTEYLRLYKYDGVSIVFSSFYPDNPASLFGHTFLRLHKPGRARSDLLDDVVNFAAVMAEDTNSASYVLDGVFGGFPGRFSVMPYYMKIQEYNNFESRDLWEYRLNLSPTQIHKMMLSLWEVATHHADYYYFDDNCSYILLLLLETADASLDLSSQLKLWATPGSSMHAVFTSPGLVQGEHYRPSARSRYLERFRRLDDREVSRLKLIIASPEAETDLSDLSNQSQAAVIDTSLEYIDFKEKLIGDRQPKLYSNLRSKLLIDRNRLRLDAATLTSKPERGGPQNAHRETWVFAGLRRLNDQNLAFFKWQPVLHDLLAADDGFSPGFQIQMMPMEFVYRPSTHSLFLNAIDLFNIISLNPWGELLRPISWHLKAGWERQALCPDENRSLCGRGTLSGGRGITWQLSHNDRVSLLAGLFLKSEFGGHDLEAKLLYGQIGPQVLLQGQVERWLRISLAGDIASRWYGDNDGNSELKGVDGSVAFLWSKDTNLRLGGRIESLKRREGAKKLGEWTLGVLTYF